MTGRRSIGRRWVVVGLVGAVAVIGGFGTYLAMITPPYQQDESAHVGYVTSLREGQLPSLDTRVPESGGGAALEQALARPYPFSDPYIHVANNPPFAYLAALPFAEVSRQADPPGGSLLGVRLADLAGAVGAIVMAFLLGRELGGRSDFVGLVTAGTLAGVSSIATVSSLANVDGLAFCATTGVTWAVARLARTRTTHHALVLGAWCAGAAAVRPMALVFAAAAGALGLLACVLKHGWRSSLPFGLRIGGPTLVVTGWFYVLNLIRYGDATGSKGVFERYGYESPTTIWDHLRSGGPFVQTLDYLVTDVYGRDPWWDDTGWDKWLVTVIAVGLVAAAIALARRSPIVSLRSWAVVAVLGAVPMFLIAQHMSGGGAGHARYLLPVLPIVAAALALVSSRIHPLLSVGVVAGFLALQASRIQAIGHLRYAEPALFGGDLDSPIVGQTFRHLSVAASIGGALLLVAALAYGALEGRLPVVSGTQAGRRTGDT
jgi:hypothetical protein